MPPAARRTILLAVLATLVAGAAGCAMDAGTFMDLMQPKPRPAASIPVADLAVLDEGVSLATELKYDEAAGKFEDALLRFEAAGAPQRAAEAMFWLGFCHEKRGRTEEARQVYRRLMGKYGRTPAARQASRRLGRL